MQVSQLLDDQVGLPAAPAPPGVPDVAGELGPWLEQLRRQVTAVLTGFIRDRCAEYVRDVPGASFVSDLLTEFVPGGKYVRSTFTYLGWLSGAAGSRAAVRAAASTELLHAFALLQDDVMDQSGMRRGRPAAHLRLAEWHRLQGLDGPAGRFGESAAVLLADLCLVWAGQLLRDSGLPAAALARGWPRYDTLRGELAVGQFADLVNDARSQPTLDQVLDVTRRKSGNYTVRRPLELGAALAGCDERTWPCWAITASWSGRPSSCATTSWACSAGRRSPASPAAMTCVSARPPASSCWPLSSPRPASAPS